MCNLRIRKVTAPSYHPHNALRILRPTIAHAMHAVKHHFANRHKSPEYRRAARNWAQGVKELDAKCGYSTVLAQTLGKIETPIDTPET